MPVTALPVTDRRDPVAMLRDVADAIERGDHGEVGTLGIVVMGNTVEVFGAGVDYAACSVALLLHAGFQRMSTAIAEHGRA